MGTKGSKSEKAEAISETKEVKVDKFTLKQAEEQLVKKAQEEAEDRKARMTEFNEIIQQAMMRTNCMLQVDPKSPLDDIRIIVVSRT